MARKIAINTLNASTLDILNVIRENASVEYQNNVPIATTFEDVRTVGEILYGSVALTNQFLSALVNKIALTVVSSAVFNNPLQPLKKGQLGFGEMVENIFVSMAESVEYSAEKASAREFKRKYPDVKAAFHPLNYQAMYQVTVQEEDLRMAFTSEDGFSTLVDKIRNSIIVGANYDEYLITKYLIIKAITSGKMHPVSIGDGTDLNDAAVKYRGLYNKLPFISADYSEAGVKTATPKENVAIFMSAEANAEYDVNVLASAFNMDKAEFMGKLYIVDDWTTFDNDRFRVIMGANNSIEEVTSAELGMMADVKAVMCDADWFQIYDKLSRFTQTESASGLYTNLFYHDWKVVSHNPFVNAIVFVTDDASVGLPSTFSVSIASKDVSDLATTFTLAVSGINGLKPSNVQFVQTNDMVDDGIAVMPIGAVLIPADKTSEAIKLTAKIGETVYEASTTITGAASQGASVSMVKKA